MDAFFDKLKSEDSDVDVPSKLSPEDIAKVSAEGSTKGN